MRTWILLLGSALAWAAPLEIRIIYDNTAARADLKPDWGFAALVTLEGRRVLFDAGANGELFMENLKRLEIDPGGIEHLVISHDHKDHTGGIALLKAANPRLKVHLPGAAFQVVPGIFSTGAVEGPVREQALVIETAKGLVVLTGCSHPGVVKMVAAAQKLRGKDSVRLLLGGFHMLQQSAGEIQATRARLKELKVAEVVPMHCSGELAIKLFGAAGRAGAGRRLMIE